MLCAHCTSQPCNPARFRYEATYRACEECEADQNPIQAFFGRMFKYESKPVICNSLRNCVDGEKMISSPFIDSARLCSETRIESPVESTKVTSATLRETWQTPSAARAANCS